MNITRTGISVLAAVTLTFSVGACQNEQSGGGSAPGTTKAQTSTSAPTSKSQNAPTSTTPNASQSQKSTYGAPQPAKSSAPATPSSADGTECAAATPAQAMATAVKRVPPYTAEGIEGDGWHYTSAGALNHWDACSDLSWIALPIEGSTASSPWQIALFHHGKYVGTATAEGQGFMPKITRINDIEIKVVYTYPTANESNAGASGRTTAYFTWSDVTNSVRMTGSIPPVG